MKKSHKLFFAIPFDTATKELYGRVSARIREHHREITVVIGNQEIGPSPEYSEFATFKLQNRELREQFVDQIKSADIVIADLTHNNPNVHVEIGIALMENKNVLRVTGRSFTELGFDIRNLEVSIYQDEDTLVDKIENYLQTFLKIKSLPLSADYASLYSEAQSIELRAIVEHHKLAYDQNCLPDIKIRDGAVLAEFELLETKTKTDWFGIFFRAGETPSLGSQLVYARRNGRIEVATFPGPQIIDYWELGHEISGRQTLELQFENDQLELKLGEELHKTVALSRQVAGRILPAVHDANADISTMQVICRDTIEWNI